MRLLDRLFDWCSKSSGLLRLVLVSINIGLALWIFKTGFLLQRQEISAKSSCSDAHAQPGQHCWMKPQYRRTILILVDALRYDFLVPIAANSKRNLSKNERFYRGQMTKIGELIASGKASIGTLLADPPTTTLQRLKALTTGTLPTFIDAGDNFSSDVAVNEDSFVFQAAKLGRNVTLLGDDTWLSLYPKFFAKTAAFDSFDINDLNSVDDKIAPILEQEVNSSDSSLIIAHFLGVDHCGHKFGPSHPVMADTLGKIDGIIARTANSMRPDDLLVVIGDHGMTETGDHGGESENEIRAGIMVHSKKQTIRLPRRPLHQIDIVPTLSLLMGLPIPFSNLGTVIREMFPRDLWEIAVGMNYEQVKRFAETYATQKSFGELHSYTARDANSMEDQLNTMSRIQTVLRVAWTQFDDSYINVGLFSLVEAVGFLMTNEIFTPEWAIFRTGCAFLQLSLLFDKTDSDGSARTLLLMSLVVSCLSSIFSLALKSLQFRISSLFSARTIGSLFVLFHSISLFSNSFVVYEARITRFLLQSLLFLIFIANLRSGSKPRRPFKFHAFLEFLNQRWIVCIFASSLVLTASEFVFHRCREEETDCKTNIFVRQAAGLSRDAQISRLAAALLLLLAGNYTVFKVWANSKTSETMRVLSAISYPLIFLIVFHFILNSMVHDAFKATLSAQIVLLVSLAAALVAWRDRNTPIGLHFLMMPVFVLFGDGMVPALVFFVALSVGVAKFVDKDALPSVVALLAPFGFYLLGHSPEISAIPWLAAFVFTPGSAVPQFIPAFFVVLHVFFSTFSSVLALPTNSYKHVTECLILMTIRATFACFAASTHRRHLMVWKIFAPKFIFEGASTLAFIVFVNLFYLVIINVFRLLRNDQIDQEEKENKNKFL